MMLLLPLYSIWLAYTALAGCGLFQVSIYVIQIIFGAVDFPAKLLALGALTYLGRRFSQAACLFLSSLVIFANIFIPPGKKNLYIINTLTIKKT